MTRLSKEAKNLLLVYSTCTFIALIVVGVGILTDIEILAAFRVIAAVFGVGIIFVLATGFLKKI